MQEQFQSQEKQASSWFEEEEQELFDESAGIELSPDAESRLHCALEEIQQDKVRKNRRRRHIVIGSAVAVIGVLAVIIGAGVESRVKESPSSYSQSVIANETFSLADNGTFTLAEKSYAFPLSIDQLTDDGWQFIVDEYYEDITELSENDYVYGYFYKDGKRLFVALCSDDGSTKALEKADIQYLSVDDYRTPEFTGPFDIYVGMSEDEVTKRLAEAGVSYSIYADGAYSSYGLEDNRFDSGRGYDYMYDVYCWEGEVTGLSLFYSGY